MEGLVKEGESMSTEEPWAWLKEMEIRHQMSSHDESYLQRPIGRSFEIAIKTITLMRSALEKSQDSEYWQEHRYPGTSGFQSQREYIAKVLDKCSRGKFE